MKTGIVLAAATAAACLGAPAAATKTNLIVNGSFETVGHVPGYFMPGWKSDGEIVFLDAPGTADDVYGPWPVAEADPTSPDGGNFLESDGTPEYTAPISQTISGLTPGESYTLAFYQAAGEKIGSSRPKSVQWSVTFGDQTQFSSLFSVVNGSFHKWTLQSMTFVASAETQDLSFLAIGPDGGGAGIAFLDGVRLTAAVPEPASWAMMILGFGAIGGALRRRQPAVRIA